MINERGQIIVQYVKRQNDESIRNNREVLHVEIDSHTLFNRKRLSCC